MSAIVDTFDTRVALLAHADAYASNPNMTWESYYEMVKANVLHNERENNGRIQESTD